MWTPHESVSAWNDLSSITKVKQVFEGLTRLPSHNPDNCGVKDSSKECGSARILTMTKKLSNAAALIVSGCAQVVHMHQDRALKLAFEADCMH